MKWSTLNPLPHQIPLYRQKLRRPCKLNILSKTGRLIDVVPVGSSRSPNARYQRSVYFNSSSRQYLMSAHQFTLCAPQNNMWTVLHTYTHLLFTLEPDGSVLFARMISTDIIPISNLLDPRKTSIRTFESTETVFPTVRWNLDQVSNCLEYLDRTWFPNIFEMAAASRLLQRPIPGLYC